MQHMLKKLWPMVFCVFPVGAGMVVPDVRAEEELAPGFNVCTEKAKSTVDNLDCLNAAYEYWDKELNANFKKSLAACDDGSDAKQCRAKILKAQRLWVQYKEAMGEALYAMGGRGTLDSLTVGNFAAEETKKQAKLLAPPEH